MRPRSLPRFAATLILLSVTGRFAAGGSPPPSTPRAPADLVLINGIVLTMDKTGTVAEAVAVAGDTITAVGKTSDIKMLAGPSARVVDLQGRALLPGFIDSRISGPLGFWELGSGVSLVDSSGSPLSQADEVETRLREWIAANKPAPYAWVVGAGFDPRTVSSKKFDRALGDRAAPDNPLMLLSLDHHVALLNSRAIGLVGLKNLAYPPGSGDVLLDGQGAPTGLVKEVPAFLVMNRVWGLLPETVRREATVRFFETANRFGITTVGMPLSVPGDLAVTTALLGAGEMPVRVVAGAFGPNNDACRALDDYRASRRSPDPDRLAIGSPLYPLDGAPIGWGAALFQVYRDAPWTSGFLTMPPEEVDRLVASWASGRQGLILEASGSLAVHVILDAAERIRAAPGAGVRIGLLRADGLELISGADRDRLPDMARAGIVVSLQPTRFPYRVFLQNAIGEERMKEALPYRALVEAGIPVAINSDWPMSAQTFQPTKVIEWAVTRAGWRPEEGLTVVQSLRAYTSDAARALGMADRVGSIEPGKKADLAVLDRNPIDLSSTPEQIGGIAVRMTVSGGAVVFEDRRIAEAHERPAGVTRPGGVSRPGTGS